MPAHPSGLKSSAGTGRYRNGGQAGDRLQEGCPRLWGLRNCLHVPLCSLPWDLPLSRAAQPLTVVCVPGTLTDMGLGPGPVMPVRHPSLQPWGPIRGKNRLSVLTKLLGSMSDVPEAFPRRLPGS